MKTPKWQAFTGEPSSVFAASTYRDLLYARLAEHRTERGYQKRLAEAAGCRPSYLSQVLNSHIQLTPDQAAGLAEFWHLSEDETEYFLGLVSLERSSSQALRRHLERRLAQLRDKHMRLSSRVEAGTVNSQVAQAHYYTNWYTPAIHVLLGQKKLRTAPALSAHLKVPELVVHQALKRLCDAGLAKESAHGFLPTEKSLHLSDESPFLTVYHANWRQQAIQRLQQSPAGDVHYTGLYAIGDQEVAEIREQILGIITRSRAVAAASVGEGKAVCMLCDFFPV